MNLGDAEPGHGASAADDRPGAPNWPNETDLESTHVTPSVPPMDAPESPGTIEQTSPVLGVVIVYSETHEPEAADPDPRLGRVYPLREGEILFVGRPPAPPSVSRQDGEAGPPTHCHLFPHDELYGYISRRHLTIEMDQQGGIILTDYSRHGIYLAKANTWHRRSDPLGPPASHRVSDDETVILMDGLGEPTNRDYTERRSRYCLEIRHAARMGGRDPKAELHP